MDDINSLENSFKDLQDYSDKQFHTINSLKQEIEKLKQENNSLKTILEGNLPPLEFKNSSIGISNEQIICETQLKLLKDTAMRRELNADETRRFATFFEVLEKIRKTEVNVEDVVVKNTSDEDLLKLVVSNDNTGK